jgi:hypothetical protein
MKAGIWIWSVLVPSAIHRKDLHSDDLYKTLWNVSACLWTSQPAHWGQLCARGELLRKVVQPKQLSGILHSSSQLGLLEMLGLIDGSMR